MWSIIQNHNLTKKCLYNSIFLPIGEDGVLIARKKKKKVGGAFGHFFIDLSPAIKKLVLDRIKENKKRIQSESYLTPLELAKYLRKMKKKSKNTSITEDFDFSGSILSDEKTVKIDTFVPKTNLTQLKEKNQLIGTGCDYDCGTGSETEMLEEIFLMTKKLEKIAIGVQRMRRIKIVEVIVICVN